MNKRNFRWLSAAALVTALLTGSSPAWALMSYFQGVVDDVHHRGVPIQVCTVCGMTRLQHFDPFIGVSGDKAVDALLKLVKVREEMAEAILQVTSTPGYCAGGAAGHIPGTLGGPVGLEKPKLSTEEIRGAAMAILKQRRAKPPGEPDAAT